MNSHVLIANFGNDSVALLQWCIENGQKPIVLSVNTHWAHSKWQKRIEIAQAFCHKHDMPFERVDSMGFRAMVVNQKRFPSQSIHFCTSFLKGLPINEWLNTQDPDGDYTILLGYRAETSRLELSHHISKSPYYGERDVSCPLWTMKGCERDRLAQKAGFEVLTHPSLECSPCIHMDAHRFKNLSAQDIAKVTELENTMQKTMFKVGGKEIAIEALKFSDDPSIAEDVVHTRCPGYFGCGL